jgi:hypothetical protein
MAKQKSKNPYAELEKQVLKILTIKKKALQDYHKELTRDLRQEVSIKNYGDAAVLKGNLDELGSQFLDIDALVVSIKRAFEAAAQAPVEPKKSKK